VTRLHGLLLAMLSASAIALVSTAYEARSLFAALDRAAGEAQQLAAEHKRLDAERQAQATHLRVERLAREKLQMRPATAAITEYVVDPGASGAAR
jgi:cell division protein FtsL